MERCRSPVLWARASQWVVLPTPGVPVTTMFGDVRIVPNRLVILTLASYQAVRSPDMNYADLEPCPRQELLCTSLTLQLRAMWPATRIIVLRGYL
jgi:hypothetical protein